MKTLSLIFIILAGISLILGIIFRILVQTFPGFNVPPQSFLEFTIACLLFAIATSVYVIADKR